MAMMDSVESGMKAVDGLRLYRLEKVLIFVLKIQL